MTRKITSLEAEILALEQMKENADEELRAAFTEQQEQMRKKAGRKPLPETEARRNCLSIRFTDGELTFLKLVAEERGEELAPMIARFALDGCKSAFLNPSDAINEATTAGAPRG